MLHHSDDPAALLQEVRRVTRRHILVMEDQTGSAFDRLMFLASHRVFQWTVGLEFPRHTFAPDRWTELAATVGLQEERRIDIGRSLGWLASRHVQFVWGTGKSIA